MDLAVVGVHKGKYERVPVLLKFCHTAPHSSYPGGVEILYFSIVLRMIFGRCYRFDA